MGISAKCPKCKWITMRASVEMITRSRCLKCAKAFLVIAPRRPLTIRRLPQKYRGLDQLHGLHWEIVTRWPKRCVALFRHERDARGFALARYPDADVVNRLTNAKWPASSD